MKGYPQVLFRHFRLIYAVVSNDWVDLVIVVNVHSMIKHMHGVGRINNVLLKACSMVISCWQPLQWNSPYVCHFIQQANFYCDV